MEKISKYQEAILDYLNTYAREMYASDPSGIDTQIVADREGHHYELVRIGWRGKKYVHYCPLHFDIKNGKVWIQINNTEEMVGDELIKRGIPREEIILGFQPQYARKHSGFGVA